VPSVDLRVLSLDDWGLWRALRLRALADAPHAFGSTLAEWSGENDTEDRWRNRLSTVPLNLVASIHNDPVGMASATSPNEGAIEVISIWVAPEARRSGVGSVLIDAISASAIQQHVSQLTLDVRESNVSAIKFYERLGFVDVGVSPNSDRGAIERQMLRLLS
jgi:ribosomal protein S18 acetylase RimI-like enzyme